jgi:hypothetical protein
VIDRGKDRVLNWILDGYLTEKEGLMFFESIIKELTVNFGEPARRTKKVVAWDVGENQGVVLQIDTPKNNSECVVWLPLIGSREIKFENFEIYPPGRGRHSGTYPSPGLEDGKAAVKMRVNSRALINDIVVYLQDL